ncbi:MAG: 2Fe-2S iron-sulfur cluster-binding protein, partial [Pseudanabaenaceae cyanobacterium]
MATLHCLPDRQDLPIESTETVLEVLQNHGIPVQHVCNGNGECSTCRIVVESGLERCTPRTRKEEALAKKLGFPPNIRLSCQTGTTGDVTVRRLVIDHEDIAIADSQFDTGIGEYRDQTVLVMTLRGGSDFDLSRFPYDALYVLNRFYRLVNRAVTRYQGRLNSALGNKTVVLFDRLQDGRSQALRTGLAIANDLQ